MKEIKILTMNSCFGAQNTTWCNAIDRCAHKRTAIILILDIIYTPVRWQTKNKLLSWYACFEPILNDIILFDHKIKSLFWLLISFGYILG